MITEQDLRNAIAECQGERHPNANTCIKLAAYLTILESMQPKEDKPTPIEFKAVETANNDNIVGDFGDSDFYKAIQGKDIQEVLAIFNELMDTIAIMCPNLYDGVMHQLL